MNKERIESRQNQLVAGVSGLWGAPEDRIRIAACIKALDTRYDLYRKMRREPGVAQIIEQMAGRLARSFGKLSDLTNKRILDIACGSNTSKLPASLNLKTPFGDMTIGAAKGYTALFEPWFCRILFELGTTPVGVDFGNLEQEAFIHYQVDLGKPGALDFLPGASFDGIQDSRLFGSPEFTDQFPNQADRLKVAHEINWQEQRVLKPGGIIIHSDARTMLK
jgi:hypothetical protein